jgi:hypothetical protein
MKMLKNTIGVIAALAAGIEAAHACGDSNVDLGGLEKGIYYSLTPSAAKTMKIDLQKLAELAQAKSASDLAFQIKQDGELDLSVFENGAFKILAADIVKASAL